MWSRFYLGCFLLLAGCASGEATPRPADPSQGVVRLSEGIEVDRVQGEIRVPARVGVDMGWIEQVACVQGSRDHEALLVVTAQPSNVHAALLVLGLEPGRPGYWRFVDPEGDGPEIERVAPEGSRVGISVRSTDANGDSREQPVSEWLVGVDGARAFPEQPWVFGGSMIDAQGVYVADRSGSLVGLVTFGDEVLGLESVMADQTGVDAAEWRASTEAIPQPGTAVTLVIRGWPETE